MQSVSVVLAVYQNAVHVRRTIDSVLQQQEREYELIIVSDGAEPSVLKVLKDYEGESRVRCFYQDNQGLTKALIVGCEQANHPYIARIDAGDTMSPLRLALQATCLDQNDQLGVVASWVTVRTDEGHDLYAVSYTDEQLKKGLSATQGDDICTPFHASVMFRKSVYQQVGGYRAAYYFTQDADLWSRMIEISELHVIEKNLTHGIFSPAGISGQYAQTQQRLAALVAQANALRQQGKSDEPVLQLALECRPDQSNLSSARHNKNDFAGLYFIAKVLSNKGSSASLMYWRRALAIRPWSLRCWLFYCMDKIKQR